MFFMVVYVLLLMDVNQIMKILPHRPPFLLVDNIIEMSKSWGTPTWYFFHTLAEKIKDNMI